MPDTCREEGADAGDRLCKTGAAPGYESRMRVKSEKQAILKQVYTLQARLTAGVPASEVAHVSAELDALKGQLAKVDVQINQRIQQLEALGSQEQTPAAGQNFEKAESYRQLLDATRYCIVIPDNIGHGKSSSRR